MLHRILLALLPLVLVGCGATGDSDPTEWIREHARPLSSLEPGGGFEDLRPFRETLASARIVALGEPTPGLRETFRLKHRLLEYLVEELDCRTVAMSMGMGPSERLDGWLQTGDGDLESLLVSIRAEDWDTVEMLELLRWMRAYNESGRGPLRLIGFDMQQFSTSINIVRRFFAAHEPEALAEIEASYIDANNRYARATLRKPAAAIAALPLDGVAGRTATLAGWIRTKDVVGRATLTLQAADATGRRVGGLDLGAGAPSGTTDWTSYEVELELPVGVATVVVGMLIDGSGEAWFDDLTLGGRTLDFESGLGGVELTGTDARSGIAEDQAHGGSRSLHLVEDRETRRMRARGQLDPALEFARGIAQRLEGLRNDPPDGVMQEELDWAIQNAWVVVQALESFAEGGAGELADLPVSALHPVTAARQRSMADNVSWIVEHSPRGSRVAVWGSNLEVARSEGWMGAHLARRYDSGYLALGIAVGEGDYRAHGQRGPGDFALAPLPPDGAEALLRGAGGAPFLLDLRPARESGNPAALVEPLPFRAIGWMASEDQFHPAALAREFDLLAFVDAVSPTTPAN